MCTDTFYDQCHIFFNKMNVLQCHFKYLVRDKCQLCLNLQKKVHLATSGTPEIWQDHQISRAGGPMVHCLETLISSTAYVQLVNG